MIDCDQGRQPAQVIAVQSALNGQVNQAAGSRTVESPARHQHDCDHCPICQHQSMGQHFIASAPSGIGLAVCEILLPGRIASVHCPALFSSSQPRAPPIA
jgi:hypothetical protein